MPLDSFSSASHIDESSQDRTDTSSGIVDHVQTTWGKALSGKGTTRDYAEVAAEAVLGASLVVGGALLTKGEGASGLRGIFQSSAAEKTGHGMEEWNQTATDCRLAWIPATHWPKTATCWPLMWPVVGLKTAA